MNGFSEQTVRSWRLRWLGVLAARTWLFLLMIWFTVAGLSVLVARFLDRLPATPWIAVPAGVALLGLLALLRECRRAPATAQLEILLDAHSRCGGLLACRAEVEVGAWKDRMPDPTIPALHTDCRSLTSGCLAALLFLVAATLVPLPHSQAGPPSLQLDGVTEELAEQIEILAEEELLTPEKQEELEKIQERIKAVSHELEPTAAWAALDRMAEALREAAQEGMDDLELSVQDARAVEALARSIAGELAKGNKELGNRASKELLEQLSALDPETRRLASELGELLKDLGAKQGGRPLSAEDLKRLQQAAGNCKQADLAKLARLCEAKLGQRLGSLSPDDREAAEAALAAWLSGQEGDKSACLACSGMLPGQGGISRGRGDADLTWKDPSSETGIGLSPHAVKADLSDPENSQLVSLTAHEPEPEPENGVGSDRELSSTRSAGYAATAVSVLPRHRHAVNRYFKREEQHGSRE